MKFNLAFVLSSFIFSSTALWGASFTSVRLNPDIDLVINGTTTTTFLLNSVEPSGDATAETAPAKIYIPMSGPIGTEASYFIVKGVNQLFSPTSNSTTINFPLYINTTASDFYLYVAIKESSGPYKLARQFSATPFNGVTNLNETFSVSSKSICDQVTDCSQFTTTSGTEKTFLAYFFLSTTSGIADGSSIDPTVNTGGIYFQINMSNRIYTNAQIAPVISKVRPGDGRVTIEYSSNSSILKPEFVRVYNHGGTPAGVGALNPIQDYYIVGGNLLSNEFPYSKDGEVVVNGLINGSTNYLSIMFVDLYHFGTVLSDDQEGTPLAIEELLKKQSCFLLTAGFGEEHFIIEYFKHFRDEVLAKTFFGRVFIKTYYRLAPHYALVIYQNEFLRLGIRSLAYVTYFILNYLFWILGLICIPLTIFYFRGYFSKSSSY